jgi:hypothetical protein
VREGVGETQWRVGARTVPEMVMAEETTAVTMPETKSMSRSENCSTSRDAVLGAN